MHRQHLLESCGKLLPFFDVLRSTRGTGVFVVLSIAGGGLWAVGDGPGMADAPVIIACGDSKVGSWDGEIAPAVGESGGRIPRVGGR